MDKFEATARQLRELADSIQGRIIKTPAQQADMTFTEACQALASVMVDRLDIEAKLRREPAGWQLRYEAYDGKKFYYKEILRDLVAVLIETHNRPTTVSVADPPAEVDRVLGNQPEPAPPADRLTELDAELSAL